MDFLDQKIKKQKFWKQFNGIFKRGRILRILLYFIIISFILHLAYVVALKSFYPMFTFTQLEAKMRFKNSYQKIYVPYNKISPYVKLAAIASEDKLFPLHSGFDWESIEKAIEHNRYNPRRIKGGSGITQQVAKNVFLWKKRNWIRKGLEVYFTILIEWLWGKKRILELYLNVIEMGPGIIGIEAAAQHYYNKHASDLNIEEAALIIACLPSPYYLSPSYPTPNLLKKQRNIIQSMEELFKQDIYKNIMF